MKKFYRITIFLIITFGLILSNPKIQDHKNAVKEKAKEIIDINSNNLKENLQEDRDPFTEVGTLIGGYFVEKLIDEFIDNNVTIDNYFVFSLTKIKNPKTEEINIIGVGFLGNVYIPQQVVDEFKSFDSKKKVEEKSNNSEALENVENKNVLDSKSEEYLSLIPEKWTMITIKNSKEIIFNPCDSGNESIILMRDENENYMFSHNCGNDGYYYRILKVYKNSNAISFDLVAEGDEQSKYTYKFEEIENNKAIWTVRDYDDKMKKIVTTNSDFEKNYQVINEPPCLE